MCMVLQKKEKFAAPDPSNGPKGVGEFPPPAFANPFLRVSVGAARSGDQIRK